MSSCLKRIALFVLCLVVVTSARAQVNQILQPAPTKTPIVAVDPLGRGTPAGTVFGFLEAARPGNYNTAAQYLQMSPARRQSEGEPTAMRLKVVMDRTFAGNLKNVSTQPEGTPQEGVPLERQRLGIMSSGDAEANLDLVRVTDPNSGKIWLISADTLARVPELYDQLQARNVEKHLPQFVVKHLLVGMPLWQWLALLLAVPVAAALGWLILALLEVPLRWWARRRGQHDVANWRSVSGPPWLLTGTLVHQILTVNLGMPLLQRHYYFQVTTVAIIISANWILWRVIRWLLQRVRTRALARGLGGTGSLMLLGERLIKAAVFVMAVLSVLSSLGFNMTTALAGLGIGGIAIGFGAQKTIENLFGGVSVLGDEVIRVGDVCTFGDRTGVVEDIGLRSTRVRTEERSLLAIPNGTVATINIDNLSRRDKILLKTNLRLRGETTADHLRFVLSEIRKVLYSHPKIETKTVRVRLTDISASTPNIEVLSYVLTRDFNEFAAVREDILLRIMDLVQDSGTALALPAQTLYIGRDSGLQAQKTESAVKKVVGLREGKQLPFPDYHEDDIASFKGSIEYPQAESALRQSNKPQPG